MNQTIGATPERIISEISGSLAAVLSSRGWRLMTAESCTGGMIAAACTAVPGSSEWFEGGVVTYSNELKEKLLHVSSETLDSYGAVSEEVAREMAAGLRFQLEADCGIAVTGIAGPGGGTPQKPVGTVWIGTSVPEAPVTACCYHFSGDRNAVRCQAVASGVQQLLEQLKK